MSVWLRAFAAVAVIAGSVSVQAEIYPLPPDGFDVVGAVGTVRAREEETLIDIGRRHGLGYQDIVRANPDVNIWVPGEGTEVVLPTRFVLPPGPREGLVLNLAEYRMYYYPRTRKGQPGYVLTYPMSIGRMDWETPLGFTRVIAKARNPAWHPPQSIREEHAQNGDPLPRVVPAGPDNPLGTRAMRLGLPGYLIHSTNKPAGVGMRVTHGCIRMFPEDIEFLFEHIRVNTSVRIINEPVKLGWENGALVMEVHPVLESAHPELEDASQELLEQLDAAAVLDERKADDSARDPLTIATEQFIAATRERSGELDWQLVEALVKRSDGIPVTVGAGIKNAATSAASE